MDPTYAVLTTIIAISVTSLWCLPVKLKIRLRTG
jgi:hypothetical protein